MFQRASVKVHQAWMAAVEAAAQVATDEEYRAGNTVALVGCREVLGAWTASSG